MKRSEMVDKIKQHLLCYDLDLDDEELEDEAYFILSIVENNGMLPPTSTCKLVPDTYHGGIKHGPIGHNWDDEDE